MSSKNNHIYITDFITDYLVCRWCLTIIKYMYKHTSKLLQVHDWAKLNRPNFYSEALNDTCKDFGTELIEFSFKLWIIKEQQGV